jgi:hypothetical protein
VLRRRQGEQRFWLTPIRKIQPFIERVGISENSGFQFAKVKIGGGFC